jgi:tRNA A-37 threonylcarbamoyl transferase component Bud32
MAPVRIRPWVLVLAASSVIGYVVLSYLILFGLADPGLGINDDQGYVQIDDVRAGSPAAAAGFAPGDHVVTAQGQPVANLADWLALRTNFVADESVSITVERSGRRLDLAMTPHGTMWSIWSQTTRATEVIFLLSKLITLIVGLFVVFSRPRDFVGRLGGWFLVTMATVFQASGYGFAAALRALPFFIQWPVMLVHVSAAIRTPLLFTFFALFPRKLFRNAWIWALLLAEPVFVTVYALYLLARTVYDPGHLTGLVKPWVILGFGVQSLVYLIAGMVVLAVNYWRLESVTERRKLRVLTVGSLIGLASYLPRVLGTSLFEFRPFASEILDSAIFDLVTTAGYLVFPLSFAYCILRHEIFDIRIIIRRGLQYAFARRFLLAVPLFATGLLLLDLVLHGHEPLLDVLKTRGWGYAVAVGLACLAYVQRQRWLSSLDHRFFRDRYDGQKLLHDIAEQIRQSANIEQVAPHVVGRMASALHAEFCALLVRKPADEAYQAIAASPPGVMRAELRSTSKLIPLVRVFGKPLPVMLSESGWLGQPLPQEDKNFLREAHVDLMVPVALAQGRTEALFMLGHKLSEEPYSSEDILLLETVASSLALLLQQSAATLTNTAFEECPRCGSCYDTGTTRCSKEGATLVLTPAPRLLGDRYRLEKRLGQGGMGKVYQATDTAVERSVAIKVIRDELFAKPEALQRFRRESQMASGFSHPNVVTVFDFGMDSSQHAFLVMELLEGVTLRKELQLHTRLAPARTLQIFEHLCAGLAAAHSRGIVHRDLKPENIFLVRTSAPERIKITDFGVAKTLPQVANETSDTFTGVPVGTLRYMSPEQLRGGTLSRGWDIWALSVIAYEMLCGIHPFFSFDFASLPGAILEGNFTPVPSSVPQASPRWQEFFRRVLARDEKERPDSVGLFLADLKHSL